MVLILKINQTSTIGFVQAYAPTSQAKDDEMDKFYSDVEIGCKEIEKCTWKIVMGDWNGKIGQRLNSESDVMGPNGYGIRNERGERLIRFCRKNQLFIANSIFKKKPQQKWTWSLDMKTNFIMTPHKNLVKNVEVLNGFEFESDHRLVRMTFDLKTPIKKFNSKCEKRLFVDQSNMMKVSEFRTELKKYDEIKSDDKFFDFKTKLLSAGKTFESKPNQRAIITIRVYN